jgi:hypothetical protein
MHSSEPFPPFRDTALIAVTRHATEQLKEYVDSTAPSTVRDGDPAGYAAALSARFAVPSLDVKVEQARSSTREEPARERGFDIFSGRQVGDLYTQQIITVHVAFAGDPAAFRYYANTRSICSRSIWLAENEVCFDVIVPARPSADINGEVKRMLACLTENTNYINQEILHFNRSLPELAKSFIDRRQEELQRHRGIVEKLGLPLKTDDAASGTPFAPDSPTTSRSVGNFDRGHRKEAPSREGVANARSRANMETYDLFLSHAGEDKAAIARPLFSALTAVGVTVWFDEAVLKIGDSLRRKIEEGLARCRYGIVIISPAFLAKEWPQRELDGLAALEVQSGQTKILPIWHEIDSDALALRSPMLADRMAAKSTEGIDALVKKILAVIR